MKSWVQILLLTCWTTVVLLVASATTTTAAMDAPMEEETTTAVARAATTTTATAAEATAAKIGFTPKKATSSSRKLLRSSPAQQQQQQQREEEEQLHRHYDRRSLGASLQNKCGSNNHHRICNCPTTGGNDHQYCKETTGTCIADEFQATASSTYHCGASPTIIASDTTGTDRDYVLVNGDYDWNYSKQHCESVVDSDNNQDYTLAVITSAEENTIAAGLCNAYTGYSICWLGQNSWQPDEWIDGTSISYSQYSNERPATEVGLAISGISNPAVKWISYGDWKWIGSDTTTVTRAAVCSRPKTVVEEEPPTEPPDVVISTYTAADGTSTATCFTGTDVEVTKACNYYNANCCSGRQACNWAEDFAFQNGDENNNKATICNDSCIGDFSCYGIPPKMEIYDHSCVGLQSCKLAHGHFRHGMRLSQIWSNSCVGTDACLSLGYRLSDLEDEAVASSGIVQDLLVGTNSCLGTRACSYLGRLTTTVVSVAANSCHNTEACRGNFNLQCDRTYITRPGSCQGVDNAACQGQNVCV